MALEPDTIYHKILPVDVPEHRDCRVNVWCSDVPVDSSGAPCLAVGIKAYSVEYILEKAFDLLSLPRLQRRANLRWSRTGEVVQHSEQLRHDDELVITMDGWYPRSVATMTATELRHQRERDLGLPVGSLIAGSGKPSQCPGHLRPAVNSRRQLSPPGYHYDTDLNFFVQVRQPGNPHFYLARVALRRDGRFSMEEMRSCESDSSIIYRVRWDGSYVLEPVQGGDLFASMHVIRTDMGAGGRHGDGKHPTRYAGGHPRFPSGHPTDFRGSQGRDAVDVRDETQEWIESFIVMEGFLARDGTSFAFDRKEGKQRLASQRQQHSRDELDTAAYTEREAAYRHL